MRPSVRSACAAACSSDSLPFSTSFATWPWVTSRAFCNPASTNRSSTSLSTTGTPAAAMTWEISPPITPAPTTPALNTNMAATLADLCPALVGKPGHRAAQRVDHRAADEGALEERRERAPLLELVVERERHADLVADRLEDDRLQPAEPLVLDLERLPGPGLIGRDALLHEAAALGRRLPQQAG